MIGGLPDLGHKSGEKIFKASSSIHYSFSLSCVIEIDITLEFWSWCSAHRKGMRFCFKDFFGMCD